MKDIIKIIITSLGTAMILVEVVNIGSIYKKITKQSAFNYIKPFDCIPCMSFWMSLTYGSLFLTPLKEALHLNDFTLNVFTAMCGSFILATIYDKLTFNK